MYRVKNLTHYSSSKIWDTVAHGGDVMASYPARAKSHETGLQSMGNTKTENAPRRKKKGTKKEKKTEKIDIPLQEVPKKTFAAVPVDTAPKSDQEKKSSKKKTTRRRKRKKQKKVKELIKNTGDVCINLYFFFPLLLFYACSKPLKSALVFSSTLLHCYLLPYHGSFRSLKETN